MPVAANEVLLSLSALLSAALVIAAWRLDKERLHSLILLFLILIAMGGGKIVEFFGFTTNTGNVFYAAVFLATYFLIERYGTREGIRSIWIGVLGVLSFSLLFYLTLLLESAQNTEELSTLLSLAFSPVPRLMFASLLAYIASQGVNVFLYRYLKERSEGMAGQNLWLRINTCNIVSQLIDSLVFFSVAFGGMMASTGLLEILLTGFILKVLFVALFSPLLYLNRVSQEDGEEYSSLTLR
jgi:uncharacterized integral membrane protein (TIGR00697 family)